VADSGGQRRLGQREPRAARRGDVDRLRQQGHVPDHDRLATALQRARELYLVVVDVLTVPPQARHHHRDVTRAAGHQEAADARMDHHGLGELHVGEDLGHRQERDRHMRLAGRGPAPVLHDELVELGERRKRPEQPVEALMVRADGDVDHSRLPT
jgi:hypothetical protein